MIDKLTPQQEKEMEAWREKWWHIGVSTNPAERQVAEATLAEMYRIAGAGTASVRWADGPLDAKKLLGDEAPSPFSWGGAEAHWLALYTFGEHLGVPFSKDDKTKLRLWVDLVSSCGYVYVLDEYCVACERPAEIHMDRMFGVLHNDDGPAILCRDGWKVWAMNGVRVPQWLAETPADEIDPGQIAKIDNAEVRAQFVRKVTVERIYEKLKGKVLDTYWHDTPDGRSHPYELVELRIPGMRRTARFLKMLNPSTETIHMEGVPPEISKCREALKWRNPWGLDFAPVHLS